MAVPKKRTSKAKQKISRIDKKIESYYSRIRLVADRRFSSKEKLNKLREEIDRDFSTLQFYKGLIIQQKLQKALIKAKIKGKKKKR